MGGTKAAAEQWLIGMHKTADEWQAKLAKEAQVQEEALAKAKAEAAAAEVDAREAAGEAAAKRTRTGEAASETRPSVVNSVGGGAGSGSVGDGADLTIDEAMQALDITELQSLDPTVRKGIADKLIRAQAEKRRGS